ncbi:MAG: sugar phosphate isomerase/epimerase [Anaerolineae bacterium]|nr:sugar phosphate isomerase/epimerase [Anaerolineae bacterium]
MIQTGLVSVTFRKLTPRAIVDLVAEAGLDAIEWGGDGHVPHGEIETARTVRQMAEDAGLTLPSYGSYYRVGHGEPVPFETVVETAIALGAPIIRVWAGKQGTATAGEAYWDRVIEDSVNCADLAASAGLSIAYEYHANTLTDTDEAAVRLLRAVNHDAVTTYWQPRGHATIEENLAGLTGILPRLSHIHIQSWRPQQGHSHRQQDNGARGPARAPLSAMMGPWSRWLATAATAPGDHVAMIEFVANDTPEQFLADAEVLKKLITECENGESANPGFLATVIR